MAQAVAGVVLELYKASGALVVLSTGIAYVLVLKIPSLHMPCSKTGTQGKKSIVMVDCLFARGLGWKNEGK